MTNMTKEQINGLLLGLFGTAGPISKLLALWLTDDKMVAAILDVCMLLTPIVAGAVFSYLQRPSAMVASVATMSPEAQHLALTHVSDETVVQLAEGVPDVATVVVRDTATNGVAALAQDASHPHVVTETQNEMDAKKGTKVP